MKDSVLSFPAGTRVCPVCGDEVARVHYETESVPYGVGEDQVVLTARVPVIHCASCGVDVTDETAEELRHDAICRHLGRLTPSEIRAVREKYGLSQQEWATKTRLGLASIKRWEAGNQVQNEAMDCYLRLLAIPANFAKISSLNAPQHRAYQFQTVLSQAAIDASAEFELRKAS